MEDPGSVDHYVSLGDSISIDLYPGLDVAEREGLARPPSGLGAASLLHRNDDERWPSHRSRDLGSLRPAVGRTDLTADGATTRDVLERQVPRVPGDLDGPTLVTLTAGGNDLLGLIDPVPRPLAWLLGSGAPADVRGIASNLREIVVRVRERLPEALLLVATVYDPTDGTGRLEGLERPEAVEVLHGLNDQILGLGELPGTRAVDLHGHFLGHGVAEPDPAKRWYWRHSIIEPSARGAHEVRRLWWEALSG